MATSILTPLDNPITIEYLKKYGFKKFIYSVDMHKIDFTNFNIENYVNFFENKMYYEYSFEKLRSNFSEWLNTSIIRYWPANFDNPAILKDCKYAKSMCNDIRGLFTIQRRVAGNTELEYYKIETIREFEDLIALELYNTNTYKS